MMSADGVPGRSCPLSYHYEPDVFRQPPPPDLADLDVLYVVGGLYGNELALTEVLRLFDAEPGRKRLVFNGDFHWFDVLPERFARIQRAVLAHTAIRGNVETELSERELQGDTGCGCAYPDWVGDAVVTRSNRILQRLWHTASARHRVELAALPMWLTASVGECRLGIVHGDAQSLAGWGFAQEHLQEPFGLEQARGWFERAGVDAFASTHTCLPVFQRVASGDGRGDRWVFNNGATGMPNFRGDPAGLVTRIALHPCERSRSRGSILYRGVHVDALAVLADRQAQVDEFLSQWPAGSDAHASYFDRIMQGPSYEAHQMIRGDERAGSRSDYAVVT